jgi:hypothetical protein
LRIAGELIAPAAGMSRLMRCATSIVGGRKSHEDGAMLAFAHAHLRALLVTVGKPTQKFSRLHEPLLGPAATNRAV